MKYSDAVRHLESLGLQVASPDRNRHPKIAFRVAHMRASLGRTPQRARVANAKPRSVIPVRIVKDGTAAKKLLTAIRKSRAELRNSVPKRTRH